MNSVLSSGNRHCVRTIYGRSLFLNALVAAVLLSNFVPLLAQSDSGQRQVVLANSSESIGQSRGTYYALVIGIADYQYLPKLKTPVSDASEIEKVLRESYGFKTQVLPNATRDQILGALDHDQRTLGADDSLLVYYAGHGFYDKLEEQGYWAPADAGQDTYAHWITATDIAIRAKAIPARHVLVISDSCYSGKLTRSVDPTVVSVTERGPYIARMFQSKSRDLMASGGNEPVPDTDPEHPNHSVFANALILGLEQMADATFSAAELFDQRVRVQVSGRSPQMPEYNYIRDSGHDGGDFVFSRYGSGLKQASAVDVIITPRIAPPADPEKDAVRAALNHYESAYDSMDTDLLKKIWPSLSKGQIKELRAGFDGAKAVMVELRSPAIAIAGDSATVTADQWMKWTRAGHQQPPQANSVQIQLKKDTGGSWLVAEVRGR